MGIANLDQQVATYRNVIIPVFFNEYGGQSRASRTFHQTTDLYSPRVTDVFSGGCVYELWMGANGYGLALLEPKNKEINSEFPTRRKLPGDIAETRRLDSGTLYLCDAFTNYKKRLADTRDVVASADNAPLPVDSVENWKDQLFGHNPSEDVVPESCVDWEKLDRDISTL